MQEGDCSSDDEQSQSNLSLEGHLSTSALAALNQFMAEKTLAEVDNSPTTDTFVKEDFRHNQFWYDDTTATSLAQELLHACKTNGRIALLSSPRAMPALLALAPEGVEVFVFEIDDRFGELYGTQFVKYDLFAPEKIPTELHHSFDAFLFDPPFHNRDTMGLYADAIRLLSRGGSETPVFACTGRILRESIFDILQLKPTSVPISFQSKHCNPYYLYSNASTLFEGSYIVD